MKQDFMRNRMDLEIYANDSGHCYAFDEVLYGLAMSSTIENLIDEERHDEEEKQKEEKRL
jgi:hypothetical protein